MVDGWMDGCICRCIEALLALLASNRRRPGPTSPLGVPTKNPGSQGVYGVLPPGQSAICAFAVHYGQSTAS